MRLLSLRLAAVAALAATFAATGPEPDLDAELRNLQVPPPWLAELKSDYNTELPWKEARLHIRKLLDEHRNREAIKLTYDYLVVRKAAPNDHEYPLYLFLGGEYAWALSVYRERIQQGGQTESISYLNLAALYRYYHRYEDAEKTLRLGLENLPKPPWDVPNAAKIHDRLGDLYARQDRVEDALGEYAEAMRLLPTSKQPWGRQNLPKEARKIQTKVDLLKRGSQEFGKLRDGDYTGTSIGYAGDVSVTITVDQGRVEKLALAHKEHIEQHATTRIPEAIKAVQGLEVDAVTGATITSQAIIDATYQAARQAGMKETIRP